MYFYKIGSKVLASDKLARVTNRNSENEIVFIEFPNDASIDVAEEGDGWEPDKEDKI